nr:uncharacterized protein LOC121469606 [Taeniopygia guttata]
MASHELCNRAVPCRAGLFRAGPFRAVLCRGWRRQHGRAVPCLGQRSGALLQECLQEERLFQDRSFPAGPTTLGCRELGPRSHKTQGIVWRTPTVGRRGKGGIPGSIFPQYRPASSFPHPLNLGGLDRAGAAGRGSPPAESRPSGAAADAQGAGGSALLRGQPGSVTCSAWKTNKSEKAFSSPSRTLRVDKSLWVALGAVYSDNSFLQQSHELTTVRFVPEAAPPAMAAMGSGGLRGASRHF